MIWVKHMIRGREGAKTLRRLGLVERSTTATTAKLHLSISATATTAWLILGSTTATTARAVSLSSTTATTA